ncbi:MAG: P-type conjugative transfer protein TrbG [Syntrophobacterales bacterium]|nr:P-type conjugative transfer protein TrbG [Syntrophobacterales bacterium]
MKAIKDTYKAIRNIFGGDSPFRDAYRAYLVAVLGAGLIALCLLPYASVIPSARAGDGPVQTTTPTPPDEDPMTPKEESDSLKAAKSIEAAEREGVENASEAVQISAKSIFFYRQTGIYQIYCHEGHLTDIQLQPGEEVVFVGGGDTTRWMVDRAQSGSGDTKQWHIYVKPLKSNISTNFIITTDRRSYQIRARAGQSYNPIIGWTYPLDEKAAFLRQEAVKKEKEEEQVSGLITPEKINFSYKIEEKSGLFGGSYSWTPRMVFDDGMKTYIQMSPTMSSGEAPALFVSDGKNLMLVNYRVKRNYYIVDRLFAQAELINGKERVIIKKIEKD